MALAKRLVAVLAIGESSMHQMTFPLDAKVSFGSPRSDWLCVASGDEVAWLNTAYIIAIGPGMVEAPEETEK